MIFFTLLKYTDYQEPKDDNPIFYNITIIFYRYNLFSIEGQKIGQISFTSHCERYKNVANLVIYEITKSLTNKSY